tara:strand:+ start:161 stop:463 length:303 start_codon:yes stop_codon:yes gene_type:complete
MKKRDDGNLHTLIKPIIYVLNDEEDQSNNILGWDEVILLAHDNNTAYYMGVVRKNGVFDSQDYSETTADEFFNVMMGPEYSCQGFIDLENVNATYLYATL